ncbi:conserved Plasmodium protein, unknown function [Plasmodium gallinaceum]|uniref:Uncharacterized protein n=1 Tax=Plasmodium gallinaceum TaxID=5849 RepID=A0A1J1GPA4_PLAGA|nr:conserved Plasmodium protein, unknown function [Plasmodium gallinaceum]CRG94327.1 conserved Plasmodium protein, unknown function [Plasmodium gallinaceum]
MLDGYISNKKIYELICNNKYSRYENEIKEVFENKYCKILNYLNLDNKYHDVISMKLQQFINENLTFNESKSYFFGFSKELLVHCLKVYFYEEYSKKKNFNNLNNYSLNEDILMKKIQDNSDSIDMDKLHLIYCDEYFYIFRNILYVLKKCDIFYFYLNYKPEDFEYEKNFLFILFSILEKKFNIHQLIQIYFDTYKDTNNYFELIKINNLENTSWVYKYILLFLNIQIYCINIFFYLQLRLNVLSKSNFKSFLNIFLTFSNINLANNYIYSDIITNTLQQKEYSIIFLIFSISNLITFDDISKYVKCSSSSNLFKLFFYFKNENSTYNFEQNILMLSQCLYYFDDIIKNFVFIDDNFVYKKILLDIINNSLCSEENIYEKKENNNDSINFKNGEIEEEEEEEKKKYRKKEGNYMVSYNMNTSETNNNSNIQICNLNSLENPNYYNSYSISGDNENQSYSDLGDLNISLIKDIRKYIERKEFFKKNINIDMFLNICNSIFKKQNFLLFLYDIKKAYKNIKIYIDYLQNENFQYNIYLFKYFFYDYDYNSTEIITNDKERKKLLSPFISVECKNILLQISTLFFSYDYLKMFSIKKNNEKKCIHNNRKKNNAIYHPIILHNVNKLLLEFFYNKMCNSSIDTLLTFNHNLLSIYRILKVLIGNNSNLVSFNEVCKIIESLNDNNKNKSIIDFEHILYYKILDILKKKNIKKNTIYITYLEYYYILIDYICKYLYNNYCKNIKNDFFKDNNFTFFKNIIIFFCKILSINKCFHILIEVKLQNYFKLTYDIKNSFINIYTYLFFFSLKYNELKPLNYSIVSCLLFLLKKKNINKLNAYIFQMFSYMEQEDQLREEQKENDDKENKISNSNDTNKNSNNDIINNMSNYASENYLNSNTSNYKNLENYKIEKDFMEIKENFKIDISFLKIFFLLNSIRRIDLNKLEIKEKITIEKEENKNTTASNISNNINDIYENNYNSSNHDLSYILNKNNTDNGNSYGSNIPDFSSKSVIISCSQTCFTSNNDNINNRSNNHSNCNYYYYNISDYEICYNNNITENISLEEIFVITLMYLCQVDNNYKFSFVNDLLKLYEEEKRKKIYECTEIILKLFKKIMKKNNSAYFYFNICKSFQTKICQVLDSINILIKKWTIWTVNNCDETFKKEKNININELVKLFFISYYKYLKNYFIQVNNFFYNCNLLNSSNHFHDFVFLIFSKYINKVFIDNFSAPFIFKSSKFCILNMCLSIINYMINISKNINIQRIKEINFEFNSFLLNHDTIEENLENKNIENDFLDNYEMKSKINLSSAQYVNQKDSTFYNFMNNIMINHKTLLTKSSSYIKKKVNIFQIETNNNEMLHNNYTMDYLTDIVLLEKENNRREINKNNNSNNNNNNINNNDINNNNNIEKLFHHSTINFNINDLSTNGNSLNQLSSFSKINNSNKCNFTFLKFFFHIKDLLKIIFQNNYVFFLSDFLLMNYEQKDNQNIFKYNFHLSNFYYSIFNSFINNFNTNYFKNKNIISYSKNKSNRKIYKQIINRILLMYSILLEICYNFTFVKEVNNISMNIANQIFSLFDTSHLILNLFSKMSLDFIQKNDIVSKAINNDILSIEKKHSNEKREILSISLLYFFLHDYKNIYVLYENLNKYFKMNDYNNIYFLCKYSKGFISLSYILKFFTDKFLFYFNKINISDSLNLKIEYTKRSFKVLKFLYLFIKNNDLIHISIYEDLFNVLLFIIRSYVEKENYDSFELKSYKFNELKNLNLSLHFINSIYLNIFNDNEENIEKKKDFWENIEKIFNIFINKLQKNVSFFFNSSEKIFYNKELRKELYNYLYNLNIISEIFEIIIKGVYIKDMCANKLIIYICYDKNICRIFFNISHNNLNDLLNKYLEMLKKKEDSASNLKILLNSKKNIAIEKYGLINDDSLIENMLQVLHERKIDYKYIINISENSVNKDQLNESIFVENNDSITIRSILQNKIELLENDYVSTKFYENKSKLYGEKNYLFDIKNYYHYLNNTTNNYQENSYINDVEEENQNIFSDNINNDNEYKSDIKIKKKIDSNILRNLYTIFPDTNSNNLSNKNEFEFHMENKYINTNNSNNDSINENTCSNKNNSLNYAYKEEKMERKKMKKKEKKRYIYFDNNVSSIFAFSNYFKNEIKCMKYINLTYSTYDSKFRLLLLLYKFIIIIKHKNLFGDENYQKEEKLYLEKHNIASSSPFLFFIYEIMITFMTSSNYINQNSFYYVIITNILINFFSFVSMKDYKEYEKKNVLHNDDNNNIKEIEKDKDAFSNNNYKIFINGKTPSNNKETFKNNDKNIKNSNDIIDNESEHVKEFYHGIFFCDLFIDESYIISIKNKNDSFVFDILNNISKRDIEKYEFIKNSINISDTDEKCKSVNMNTCESIFQHQNSLIYNMPLFLSLFVRVINIHLHFFKFYNKNVYFLKNFNTLYIPNSILKHIYPANHFNINLFVNLLELFYISIRIYNNHFIKLNKSLLKTDEQKDKEKKENIEDIKGNNNNKLLINHENTTNNINDNDEDNKNNNNDDNISNNIINVFNDNNNFIEKNFIFDIYMITLKEILKECYEAHHIHMKNEENIPNSYLLQHLLLYFLYNRINTIYELFYYYFFKCLKREKRNIFDSINEKIYNLLENIIYDQINKINNFLENDKYYYFYINTLTFICLNKNICLHIIKKNILTKLIYVPLIYHSIFDKNKSFSSIYYISDDQYIRNKNHIIFCSLIVLIIKLLYIFVKNLKNTNKYSDFYSDSIYDFNKNFEYNNQKYMSSMKNIINNKEFSPYDSEYNEDIKENSNKPSTSDKHNEKNNNINDENYLKNNNQMNCNGENYKKKGRKNIKQDTTLQTNYEIEFFLNSILNIIEKLMNRINFIFLKIEKINCLAIFEESYLYVELFTKISYYCNIYNVNNFLISLMEKGVEHHLFYINRILEKFIYEKEVFIEAYSPYEISASSNISNVKEKKKMKKNELSLFTQRVLYICYKSILNYNTILLNIIQTPYFTYSHFVIHLYTLLLKSTRLVTNIIEHFGRKNTTLIRTIKVNSNLSYVPICLDIVNTMKEKKKEKIHYTRGAVKSSFSCYLSDSNSYSDDSTYSGEIIHYNRSIDEYINTKRIYKNDYLFNFLPEMIELKVYYNILKEILERSAFLGAFILDKLKNSCEDSCLKQILISNVFSYLIHINATLLPSNICTNNLKKKCTLIYNYVVHIHKK